MGGHKSCLDPAYFSHLPFAAPVCAALTLERECEPVAGHSGHSFSSMAAAQAAISDSTIKLLGIGHTPFSPVLPDTDGAPGTVYPATSS